MHLRKVGVGQLLFLKEDPHADVRERSGGGFQS